MQKIFHANGKQKREEVAKLISDKINFKSKTVTRNKEKNYKEQIHQEEIIIINVYAKHTY